MRVVLDTNVAIAGLLWRGTPYALVQLALAGKLQCLAAEALIVELERALGYAKFAQRLAALGATIPALVADYLELVELVPVNTIERVLAADPDDDIVLATALAARAQLLVTGDRALLDLQAHHDVEILSPAQALLRVDV